MDVLKVKVGGEWIGIPAINGISAYVHIKYAASQPTQDSDMKDTADQWIGIYAGVSETAPTSYTSYTWYKIKGETGSITNAYGDTLDMSSNDSTKIATAIGAKADKVSSPTNGNFAALDSNGNLTDSGHKHSDYLTSHQDISGKADKVSSATNNHFAALDSNGNLKDSGHKHSDYLTSHQDISGKANTSLIGIVETGDTATQSISAGQFVVWKGSLYTADAAISSGTTLASSGGSKNLTAVSNGGLNSISGGGAAIQCGEEDTSTFSTGTIGGSSKYYKEITFSPSITNPVVLLTYKNGVPQNIGMNTFSDAPMVTDVSSTGCKIWVNTTVSGVSVFWMATSK